MKVISTSQVSSAFLGWEVLVWKPFGTIILTKNHVINQTASKTTVTYTYSLMSGVPSATSVVLVPLNTPARFTIEHMLRVPLL
jgi:hypothetical protein